MLQSRYLTEDDLKDFGFKSLGKNVRISSDARVYGAKNISIGSNVRIDDFATLVAMSGYINISDYASIMRGCHVSGAFGVDLGPFSHLAANAVIYSATDDVSGKCMTTMTVPAKYLSYRGGQVSLGRHGFVGAGSVVLGKSSIGDGSVVGALSLVKGDLDPWGIYAGSPAKLLKRRSREVLGLERELLAH